MKDPSKPDGEEVNADGSLKPADQIKWVNSPTEESHPPIPSHGSNEPAGEPGNMPKLKKSDVSYYKSQRQRQRRLTFHENKISNSDIYYDIRKT